MQNRLVEFLKGKGLSGRELARQLGLSVSYVSLVLKGSRPVTFYFAATVAEGFGLDPLESFYMAGLLKKKAELVNAQAGPIEKVTGISVTQNAVGVTNGGEA